MPILDGFKMIEKIREESDIPIIITTAFTELSYLEQSIELGVDGYISKPINLTKLLERITKSSAKIVNERLKANLEHINRNLEHKVKEKVQELRDRDRVIFKQSKYAQMGEMVDAIAHQWRQPLTVIDILASTISSSSKLRKSEEFCNRKSFEIKEQVKHLTSTLEEFRNFLRVDKKVDIFSLIELSESTLILVKDEFVRDRIEVDISGDRGLKVKGFINEFKHILLNILNNSKDAFIENSIEERYIDIKIKKIDSKVHLFISDNAGGIDKKILPNIFKHNYTTKGEKGTGVGLYLSKTILDKIGGEILVRNIDFRADSTQKGVEFEIILDYFN